MMSLPSALSCATRPVSATVGEGLTRWTRFETGRLTATPAREDGKSLTDVGTFSCDCRAITSGSDQRADFAGNPARPNVRSAASRRHHDRSATADPVQLKGDYKPAGDQPAAIAKLVDGIESGLAHQTLLGVTGSGKTFTIANVIQKIQRPTLVLAHNKTLAAQLYGEFKEFFPRQRGGVFRLVLRLLPARSVRAVLGHVYREGLVDQRAHRADALVGDQGAAGAARMRSSSRRCRRSTASAIRRRICRWCCICRAATASISARSCGA